MRLPYRLQGQKVKSQGGAGAYCGGHLAAQLVIIIIKNVKIRVTLSRVTLQGHFTELLKSHQQKRNEVQPENEVSVTPVSVQRAMSSSGSGR